MLSQHGIRPTANRILVMQAMARRGDSFTLAELEDEIGTIDKSGIFRTLTLFKENHLVHVLESAGDGARYELCPSHDSDVADDTHVHFHCEHCGRTMCLHELPIPRVELPAGYEMTTASYIVKGTCPRCKARGL